MIKIEIIARDGIELREHIKALGGTIPKSVEVIEPVVDDTTVEEVVEPIIGHIHNIDQESILSTIPEKEEDVPKSKGRKKKTTPIKDALPPLHEPKVEVQNEVAPPKEEPKHFYSQSEFMVAMPKILNALTVDGIINLDWIKSQCEKLGVTIIFSATQDKSKMLSLYNDLVTEGKIIKKGEY